MDVGWGGGRGVCVEGLERFSSCFLWLLVRSSWCAAPAQYNLTLSVTDNGGLVALYNLSIIV